MSEHKLNVWVAIAEIVSAVAVVISLIYVGLEIHSSTLESEADIQAELLSYTVKRRYLVIESSDLSSLLAKGYADPARLSPDETLRFQSYIELLYIAWERAHMTRTDGILSAEVFDLWNDWFLSVAKRNPAFVWPMVRSSQHLHPDFVRHVNESLGNMNSGVKDE